ncbi:MAG TPA: site-2 protease family protein [Candidatus Nitrosotalea sp.]|nr:site-2 protease family protein [Candidatus Nitrosotalea sp.]
MSVQIGHVKGISIRLHFTLIITFLLIDWTLSTYFMPDYVKGLTQVDYWVMGSLGTGLLFFSILLHELSHSVVAKRFNIPVKSITLFIFGGVSDIAKEPEDFHQEFKMAIAGPLSSFGIGAALALFLLITTVLAQGSPVYLQAKGILYYGMIANFALGVFNLIPAFPLDGGRVLRAALVRWKKDYHEATRIATSIGIIISYGFMGVGFLILVGGDFVGGIWIVLIGWFLHAGAQSYMSQFDLMSALRGIVAGRAMNTQIISVNREMTLDFVLKNYFAASMKSEFPVVDEDGRLIGMVVLKEILKVPESQRKTVSVGNIMFPTNVLATVLPNVDLEKALLEMVKKRVGKIFVCSSDGKLLGVISKTDIFELAGEQRKYVQTMQENMNS